MRAVVQRVKRAEVRVGEEVVGRIGFGFVVLLGVGKNDTEATGEALAEKIANLRVFDDDQGRMNRSLLETGGKRSACRSSRSTAIAERAGARVTTKPRRPIELCSSTKVSLNPCANRESPRRRGGSAP